MTNSIQIPYTLCFCIIDDFVLLLFRNKSPNKGLWNGIGGKIESGESVRRSLFREVLEESSIDLSIAPVQYTGVVCWNTLEKEHKGMYCFFAFLPSTYHFYEEKKTREGVLAWKKLPWLLDVNNQEIVSNIPRFLPIMLSSKQPKLYVCQYTNSFLKTIQVKSLPKMCALND